VTATRTTTAPTTSPSPATSAGDDDVIHIIRPWESVICRLRRRMPRPLCGAVLSDGDPKPGPNAPFCPACEIEADR
jgi:hypothetical protein